MEVPSTSGHGTYWASGHGSVITVQWDGPGGEDALWRVIEAFHRMEYRAVMDPGCLLGTSVCDRSHMSEEENGPNSIGVH